MRCCLFVLACSASLATASDAETEHGMRTALEADEEVCDSGDAQCSLKLLQAKAVAMKEEQASLATWGAQAACWTQKDGYYIKEGHGVNGQATGCYPTLHEAKVRCAALPDCHGVTTQSNMCVGQYRVSHGGPTFEFWPQWKKYNLRSYHYHFPCRQPSCWTQKDGYFIKEGHLQTNECYPTLEQAQYRCAISHDCFGVATQSNVCGGQYRVSHGGPTFEKWPHWQKSNLRSYAFNAKCRLPFR